MGFRSRFSYCFLLGESLSSRPQWPLCSDPRNWGDHSGKHCEVRWR